jgi:tRNA isopentenyl-2-thiomethyl-A-37 hydroxylase MiaE
MMANSMNNFWYSHRALSSATSSFEDYLALAGQINDESSVREQPETDRTTHSI